MASNNEASGGAKQHNIGVQVSFWKRTIYNIVNSASNALRMSTAVVLGNWSKSDDIDLWMCAYELVQERDGELIQNYMKHLNKLHVEGSLVLTNLSDPLHVQNIVGQLIEIRENKKIRISLPPGANPKMQEEVKKLAKFLTWADMVIKEAVKNQPYAALAWSGTSIFLSVGNMATLKLYNEYLLTVIASRGYLSL